MNTLHNRGWWELAILLVLMAITTPVFWLTDVDKDVAAWFYQGAAGKTVWPLGDWWLWRGLFVYGPVVLVSVAVGALLLVVVSYFREPFKRFRRPATYVLLVIAIGPGVMVNWVFKDNWGRPRPSHLVEFNGHNTYIPPLKIGDTPHKSFPCGHCSISYSLFAVYFLARRRKMLYLGLTIAAAAVMGMSRMAAGGHFFSDILWSGYVVFLVAWLLYHTWYVRERH